MDVEKGRENCRVYVEQRKLMRVAKESGMTAEQVVEGVATGELGADAVGDVKVGGAKDHDE